MKQASESRRIMSRRRLGRQAAGAESDQVGNLTVNLAQGLS
jgi:hypothetical protein